MIEQYVFNLKREAVAAEKYICDIAGFPWIGNNAKTGKAQPGKQQTLKWANIYKRATDGKYYFEKVPDSELENIPADIIDTFNTDHPHTTEEKQSNWVADE